MKKIIMIFVLTMVTVASGIAQNKPNTSDKQGCRDYVSISRFKGANIHSCSEIDYGIFYIGLAEPVRRSFKNHGQFFKKYMEVKGKINNIQYLLPLSTGILQVYENYKNSLKEAGFTMLYNEISRNSCFYREDYYGGDAGPLVKGTDDFYGNKCDEDYYYTVYTGMSDTLKLYVVIFVGNDGDEVIVNQHVIETVPLKLGLVSAKSISQNIELMGYAVFYEVHFASGSAVISTESNKQVKEIADYLNAHRDRKFYLVGHTDNQGDFASNMELSKDRAEALRNMLINDYNVLPEQLKSYGAGSLSPVTTNNTETGRAENRRVVLVER